MIKPIILAIALLGLTACGPQSYTLRGTPAASGADGKLEVEKTETGNFMLNAEVEHLPPAKRIEAGKKVFLGWLIAEDKAPVKLGKVAYDGDDREGLLSATTTEKSFVFRITAEDSSAAEAPSGTIIFEQSVNIK
jgi:hypothetical protein